ncbi:hypothetical protein [Fibrobacter sp.]|jgi:hypothetical protein|uniref:hypothetical protein n=1 Tax=Fibrobacter sp. TaxID=35828 RepID=UPI00386ECBFF
MKFASLKHYLEFARIAGIAASLTACSGINDSWEVKGGGFIKYSIDNGEEITQELERDDVEIPFIRNRHHYLLVTFPSERSENNHQLSIMVNEPKLAQNSAVQSYTWIQIDGTPKAFLTGDNNYVTIDQKDDTKWTANINLHFTDCRHGMCDESLPPILFKGRLHYWIAEDDR